jgi:putative NIF3 family GTP cyclohydrolase 1 type 2
LLGGRDIKPFCHYHGQVIGFRARFPKAVPVAAVEQCIRRRVNERVEHFAFGKPVIRSVAAVSGGGGFAVREAAEAGVDLLLSGEATLQAFHEAREYGIHVVFAGHYATERFGVEALGRMLQKRFGVPAGFVDEGIKV